MTWAHRYRKTLLWGLSILTLAAIATAAYRYVNRPQIGYGVAWMDAHGDWQFGP